MTIQQWMKEQIINKKSKIQEQEVDYLTSKVYYPPALDEESERNTPKPTPKQTK